MVLRVGMRPNGCVWLYDVYHFACVVELTCVHTHALFHVLRTL